MPSNAADAGETGKLSSLRGRVASSGEGPASSGNIANIITVLRILLAPLFVWMLLEDAGEFGVLRYLAAGLFILAIATDSVDGHLARKRNLVTNFGKLLDPIADKVLIGAALIVLSILGELWWWVTGLILLRELGITALRMSVLKNRVIAASPIGKLKTIVQAIAISFYLVPLWLYLGEWVHWLNAILMGIALLITIGSGIDYLVKAYSHRKNGAENAS